MKREGKDEKKELFTLRRLVSFSGAIRFLCTVSLVSLVFKIFASEKPTTAKTTTKLYNARAQQLVWS